ncbi:MAG: DUF4339 domain-containing protein [Opitutales bacterium]
MSGDFYVLFDAFPETPAGPFDFDQLRELAAARRIHSGTLAARAGEKAWVPLGKRAELEGIAFFAPQSALKLGERHFDAINREDEGDGNIVESWLAVNRSTERALGSDEFTPEKLEKFRRRSWVSPRIRDYLIAVTFIALLIGAVFLLIPMTPYLMGMLGAMGAIAAGGLAWIFFGIMDPY